MSLSASPSVPVSPKLRRRTTEHGSFVSPTALTFGNLSEKNPFSMHVPNRRASVDEESKELFDSKHLSPNVAGVSGLTEALARNEMISLKPISAVSTPRLRPFAGHRDGVDTPEEEETNSDHLEPLLMENKQRFVIFPLKYPSIWEHYKKHMASFWTAEEIDLGQDQKDWATLTDNEQHFIKMVLAFFAASDGIVGENLASRFIQEIQVPEARYVNFVPRCVVACSGSILTGLWVFRF
jgi:hypothetical protein